jgi:SAM-dependent methyltransferase
MMRERPNRLPQYALPHGVVGYAVGAVLPLFHGWFYPRAARVLDVRGDDDVLDVACGSGRFLKKHASQARSIAGIDLSPIMVKAARRANRRRVAAGTAEFVLGDAAEMPWPDDRFSAASIIGSFLAFTEPQAVVRELCRVLRPGGRALVLVEWNAEDGLDHSKEAARWGMRLWREDELRSMMKGAGFDAIRITHAEGPGMPRILVTCGAKR